MREIVECVPNFSEGRRPPVIDALQQAILSVPGTLLLHQTADPDHNRSVFTFAGPPEAVLESAIRAAGAAFEHIDLRTHQGVHPRMGAADVIPFVPVRGVSMEQCVALAHRAGAELWRRFQVPVFFYESAALDPRRRALEVVRRGGFEARMKNADNAVTPDVGAGTHPSAGVSIVGARPFLLAININLASEDLALAQSIARTIRASSGGFPAVKALGLPLVSRKQVQVSMNLTDIEVTPFHVVFDRVRTLAGESGVAVAGTELIGLTPRRMIEHAAQHYFGFEHFATTRVVENAIELALLQRPETLR